MKIQIVPGDAWAQKMKAAQAAGKAPDLYTMNYGSVANSAKLEQIQPLDGLIDGAKFDDVYDNIKDFVSAQGKYYAYPMLVEPSAVLYYRKDLYEKAGLDPEKPPTTWAELIDNGKKLTGKAYSDSAPARTQATSDGPLGACSTARPATWRSRTIGPKPTS